MVSDLRRCRNGHEVPPAASICPTCGDGGSVGDASPGPDEPSGGWAWIVVGLVVTTAGLITGIDSTEPPSGRALVSFVVVVLGLVLLGIGVVAQGVLVGLRRWQHESGRPVP
ncbi:hypothetical protein [Nocardioides salarius]|uniref:hypothetical protein n=1 Tax=Nocardioides salarius TaxID=374513 RepID=UPI0030FCC7AD